MGVTYSHIINCTDFKPWNITVLVRDNNVEKIIQINPITFDQKSFMNYINNDNAYPSFVIKEIYNPPEKIKMIMNRPPESNLFIPFIETYTVYNKIKNKIINKDENNFISELRRRILNNTLEKNSEMQYIIKKGYPYKCELVGDNYILIIPSEPMHTIIDWKPNPGVEEDVIKKEDELIHDLKLDETLIKASMNDNMNEMPNISESQFKPRSDELLNNILKQNYKGRKLMYTCFVINKNPENQLYNIRDLNAGHLQLLEKIQSVIFHFMEDNFNIKFEQYLTLTMYPVHTVSCLNFTINYFNNAYANRLQEMLSHKIHLLYDIIKNIQFKSNYYQLINFREVLHLSTYNYIYKDAIDNSLLNTYYNKKIRNFQLNIPTSIVAKPTFRQCHRRYLNYMENSDRRHINKKKGYYCKNDNMSMKLSDDVNTYNAAKNFYMKADNAMYYSTNKYKFLIYDDVLNIWKNFDTTDLIIYRFYNFRPFHNYIFAKLGGRMCYFELTLHTLCIDFYQLLQQIVKKELLYESRLGKDNYYSAMYHGYTNENALYKMPYYIANFKYLNKWNLGDVEKPIMDMFCLRAYAYQRIFIANTNEMIKQVQDIRKLPGSPYKYLSTLIQQIYFGLENHLKNIIMNKDEALYEKIRLRNYFNITDNFIIIPDKKWDIIKDDNFHYVAWYVPKSLFNILFYKMETGKYWFRLWKDCRKNPDLNGKYRYIIDAKNLQLWVDENPNSIILDNFRKFIREYYPNGLPIKLDDELTDKLFRYFEKVQMIQKPVGYISDLTDLTREHKKMLQDLEDEVLKYIEDIQDKNAIHINMYIHDTNAGSQSTLHVHFAKIKSQYYSEATSDNTQYSLRLYTTDMYRLYDELEMLKEGEKYKPRRLMLDNKPSKKIQSDATANYVIIDNMKHILYV